MFYIISHLVSSQVISDLLFQRAITVLKSKSRSIRDRTTQSPSQYEPWYLIYHVDLIFFRVWNFKKYKVASTLIFFRVWTIFFLLAIFNLKEKKPLLFLNNKIKSWAYFFAPYFLHPYFGLYFFPGSQTDPCFSK